MDGSGERVKAIEGLESQRSMSESANEHQRRLSRFFSMNLTKTGARARANPSRSFNSYSNYSILGKDTESDQEDTESDPEDTKSESELITNLILPQLFDIPGEYVPMNPEILSRVRSGSKNSLETMKRYGTPMACLKSDQGDSVLHLASAWGHLELVESIVSECPCLLLEPNLKDQLPLHVAAACAGQLDVVKALVAIVSLVSARMSQDGMETLKNIYIMKDANGDNPLHSALKGQNMEVASCLVNADQRASFLANKDGISPFYIAVEAGNVSLVKEMLSNFQQGQASNLTSQLEGRKSLVHAALKSKNTEILDVILAEDSTLMKERDEEGRTCLSVGASGGYYKGICKLLDKSTSNVYECDEDGSFPIHMAVEEGHIEVVEEILKRCPSSKMLLNKQGQNILHVAAKNGKVGTFLACMIKRFDAKTKQLIEEQDVNGNTPIHLATLNWYPRSLSNLTQCISEKILKIQNNDGLTAKDIAELNLQPKYVLRERMTLMVISRACSRTGYTNGMRIRSRSQHLDSTESYKDRVNALLLAATLVATVTFAAGIAVPGGFSSSAPNLGMSILSKDISYSCFVVLNAVAMNCAVLAIIALIWAQFGDLTFIHNIFQLALPLLFCAILTMTLAFHMAVVATNKHDIFLLRVITIVFLCFIGGVTLLLFPYFIPQLSMTSGNGLFLVVGIVLWEMSLLSSEGNAETYNHTSWVTLPRREVSRMCNVAIRHLRDSLRFLPVY